MDDDRTRETRMRTPRDHPHAESQSRSAFTFKDEHGGQSIPDLVRQLTQQGSELAQNQLDLVQAEVRSGMNDLKQAAGAMAGAAVLGIAGLGVLLMGIAYLLAEAMPLWAATLTVAVATLAGAYAMLAAGQKKIQAASLDVDRTRRTLSRAPSAISGKEDRNNVR